MIPSIDDRLASVVRSLTEVILPHLPAEASLAQEQAQLCIGHLQILRAQIDQAPAYEREELADAVSVGIALVDGVAGFGAGYGAGYDGPMAALAAAINQAKAADPMSPSAVRDNCRALNRAVEALVAAVCASGNAATQARLSAIVIEHEHARVQKDRAWSAPFGFDTP